MIWVSYRFEINYTLLCRLLLLVRCDTTQGSKEIVFLFSALDLRMTTDFQKRYKVPNHMQKSLPVFLANRPSLPPYFQCLGSRSVLPYWIRMQSGQWIQIRMQDPDPEGQKLPTKVEKY
jgi:hypothetical protein